MRHIAIHLLTIFVFCNTSLAGLPPTTLKGQSETAKPTTFNFQAPYNQATTTGAATRLVETGNTNLLVNPSFEHQTFSTGWTCATFSCVVETTNISDGLKAGTVTNANTVNTVIEQSVTPTILLTGRTIVAAMRVRTNAAGFSVCSLVAGSEITCTAVPSTSNYVRIAIAITTATSGQSIGVRLKSTAATSKQVYFDEAFVGVYEPAFTTPKIFGGFFYGANTSTICSSSPCGNTAIVGTVTSIDYVSAGNYRITVPGGECSSLLLCAWSPGGQSPNIFGMGTPTTTTATASFADGAGSQINVYGAVFCTCNP